MGSTGQGGHHYCPVALISAKKSSDFPTTVGQDLMYNAGADAWPHAGSNFHPGSDPGGSGCCCSVGGFIPASLFLLAPLLLLFLKK